MKEIHPKCRQTIVIDTFPCGKRSETCRSSVNSATQLTNFIYRRVGDVFLNGLAGIQEGTALASLGELVFVLMVGFDVEILYPGTAHHMKNNRYR